MGKKGLLGLLLALACLLVLLAFSSLAENAEAADDSGIRGSEPPYLGPWYIDEDTFITDTRLNLSMDVYLLRGVRLLIVNSTLDIQTEGMVNRYVFKVQDGSTLFVINSTLLLDSFSGEQQASLNFEGGSSVRTNGRFLGSCNSFFAEDTVFRNFAPNGSIDEAGMDATFIADGKVNSEFLNVRIINRGGNAGDTSPGTDGSRGGNALFISNVSSWIDSSIISTAGASRGGGLGLTGTASGNGGLGGNSEFRLHTSFMENLVIQVAASDGGVGARGAANTDGDGSNGGDGANGGDARISITSVNVLEMYGVTMSSVSGAGGSGGNGGEAINGDGGTAGYGADGGACSITISTVDDIMMEDVTIDAIGGEGGYGGDYGRHESGTGSFGIPRPGGDGGEANIEVRGQASLIASNVKAVARAGAGLDGGGGYEQGDDGGNGADAAARFHMSANIEATGVDITSIGGNGGPGGPAFSDIRGNGGDGGDSWAEFTGLLEMDVEHFSIYVYFGEGGIGNKVIYNGDDGIPTLDVDSLDLYMAEGVFNMPLDDLHDSAVGELYNVSFDMEFGIPVLPIGDAVVTTWFPIIVWVVDDIDPSKANPLEGYEVTVIHIESGALVAQGYSDGNGKAFFGLRSFRYTSQKVDYLGSYYFIASTPDGKTTKKVRGEVQGPTESWIVIKENTFPPENTVEQPLEGTNYPFDKEEKRILEVFGFVIDPDGSPITAMYVQLRPEGSEVTAWVKFKLNLSPVPLGEVGDPEYRWGKYFPPDEHSNRWRFFFRFDIIGGDVLYENGAYVFAVDAMDGVHTTSNTVSIDVQIEPEQEPARMRIYASVNPGVFALDLAEFNGTCLNVEELLKDGVEVLYYAWDFESDGIVDFYSVSSAATFHIYPEVEQSTVRHATLKVVDSLGRTVNTTREIKVDPVPQEELDTWDQILAYMPFIIAAFLVVLVIVAGASVRSRRIQSAAADEERKRIEEAMANIHECPRCGDLLEARFATCPRCKVEDDLLEAQELIQELKDSNIIVLEQEDLLEKSLISFEGRDFDTAGMFITQAVSQAKHNTIRYHETTDELQHVEEMIKVLQDRNVQIPDVEMRIYHSKLALGRSDFDGAKEIADEISKEIAVLDATSRKDEIFRTIQRTEKEIRTAKALGDLDTAPASRAMEASKAAFGMKDYVEAERKLGDVNKLLEDPTWSPDRERDERDRRKAEEEALKISTAETAAIMEAERRREAELAAISTGKTAEGKIMTFEDDEKALEREIRADRGEVVDHEVSREKVVDIEVEPTAPSVVERAVEPEPEVEPAPEPQVEPEQVPAYHMGPPEAEPRPAPMPVARPAPVAKPAPAPKPQPAQAPKPQPAAVPKPAPAPRPAPAAKPAPAPKPVPKPVKAEDADESKVACAKCGKMIKDSWKKCPFCGEEQ